MLERKKKDQEIKQLQEELSILRRNYDRVEADKVWRQFSLIFPI
jgi:hypothetical protein